MNRRTTSTPPAMCATPGCRNYTPTVRGSYLRVRAPLCRWCAPKGVERGIGRLLGALIGVAKEPVSRYERVMRLARAASRREERQHGAG